MIISRVIGYLRDVVIAFEIGQNNFTDAYNTAFTIPDYLYALLVGGALSSAFIPVFASYISTDKEEEAWETASIVFNLSMSLMLLGILIGVVWAPQLVHWLAPGYSPKIAALTVKLTRIMFAQALFMGLAGLSMGILNSYKHFLMPAIGSVLYNLITVALGWLLAVYFHLGIMGFTLGVVAGAVANFAVQVPKLIQLGLKYRFTFNLRHPGVKKIICFDGPGGDRLVCYPVQCYSQPEPGFPYSGDSHRTQNGQQADADSYRDFRRCSCDCHVSYLDRIRR